MTSASKTLQAPSALGTFPDGTPVSPWFSDDSVPLLSALGTVYTVTDYGVCADGALHTRELQALEEQGLVRKDGQKRRLTAMGSAFLNG